MIVSTYLAKNTTEVHITSLTFNGALAVLSCFVSKQTRLHKMSFTQHTHDVTALNTVLHFITQIHKLPRLLGTGYTFLETVPTSYTSSLHYIDFCFFFPSSSGYCGDNLGGDDIFFTTPLATAPTGSPSRGGDIAVYVLDIIQRPCPLFSILFLCLFLFLWPFQLYFIL